MPWLVCSKCGERYLELTVGRKGEPVCPDCEGTSALFGHANHDIYYAPEESMPDLLESARLDPDEPYDADHDIDYDTTARGSSIDAEDRSSDAESGSVDRDSDHRGADASGENT